MQDEFISHYEVLIGVESVIIKRYLYKHGGKVKEDPRFKRIYTLAQIEEARSFLKRYGFCRVTKATEPEIWMKDE